MVVGVGEWALRYMEMGLSILPLREGEKSPAPTARRGFKDALSLKMDGVSEDTVRDFVRGYFSEVGHMGENVGIVTGIVYDVLDVDVKDGKRGGENLRMLAEAGLLEGFVGRAVTPSGGVHLFYPARINQKTELLGDGIGLDYKSAGGYVVAAPSRVVWIETDEEGHSEFKSGEYKWLDELKPPWMGKMLNWDECKKKLNVKPKAITTWEKSYPMMGAGDTLTTMCSYIRSNPEDRNKKLFWAAIKCAEAGVDEEGFRELAEASLDMSIPGENREREVDATISSAIRLVHEAGVLEE